MGKRKQAGGSSEQEFLARYDAAQFPHPSVTVDVAVVTSGVAGLRVVLTKRNEHPDRDKWALPGGFVHMDESLEQSAERVLTTKTGLKGIFLEQLYTFGDPDRDSRTRVITVSYYALADRARVERDLESGPTTTLANLEVPWKGETGGPVFVTGDDGQRLPLAFDHADILGLAVQRLRGKLDYAPVGFELLPRQFTLRHLQDIHEVICGRPLNKDSFRRRMLASSVIVATGKRESNVGHRPAELYRFRRKPSR